MKAIPKPTTVALISQPTYPLATLFYVWEQSRKRETLPETRLIDAIINSTQDWCYEYADGSQITRTELSLAVEMLGGNVTDCRDRYNVTDPNVMDKNAMVYVRYMKDVRETILRTVQRLFWEGVPCTENLNFTFHLQNIPVALREQLVRHRIGSRIDDAVGVDLIPDLASSSFWSQTMRVVPKGEFYDMGEFMVPESVVDPVKFTDVHGPDGYLPAEDIYHEILHACQEAYTKLCQAGVPIEDARNVLPMAMTHGITWTMNLKSLGHIIGKRACWVAQLGLWDNVIVAMVNELCEKVHPMFRQLIQPPCFSQGKFVGCKVPEISRERVQGRDGMPPCPLYVYHQNDEAVNASLELDHLGENESVWSPGDLQNPPLDIREWMTKKPLEMEMLLTNAKRFEEKWKLNCLTGAPL